MRGLILAFTFLTRLPMPKLDTYEDKELSSSAVWFPLVGLTIGLLLVLAAYVGMGTNPWLAALLVVLVWTGISGALHLDGAADLADALGAAHRDPERFHAVMKDPHIGTFGVIAIVSILITKLVAVAWVVQSTEINPWALVLIPAWARLGAIYWSQTLDAIAPGSGERFKWAVSERVLWSWGGLLFLCSWVAVSFLFAFAAIAALLLWRAYLKRRLSGMTGDCLGAGIEYCECFMLLAVGLL
jgi:adenosylcobinamide-GDP ribazoletransferase